jgi:hypothetical protein
VFAGCTVGSNNVLSADAFWRGSTAHDASDRIIHNPATHGVSYDPDGTGSASATPFLKFNFDPGVTHQSFFMI